MARNFSRWHEPLNVRFSQCRPKTADWRYRLVAISNMQVNWSIHRLFQNQPMTPSARSALTVIYALDITAHNGRMIRYSLNSIPTQQGVVKPAMRVNFAGFRYWLKQDVWSSFSQTATLRPNRQAKPSHKDRFYAFITISRYFMLFCQQQSTIAWHPTAAGYRFVKRLWHQRGDWDGLVRPYQLWRYQTAIWA